MSYDLNAAAKHIVHDYAYLVAAGNDTQNPLPHPYNHYAERTFLIHCRAGFFKNGTDARDMYAKDFVSQQTSQTIAEWNQWHVHIDQHLAHLTRARVANTTPWTGADNKKILDAFQATWRDFYSQLLPSVKPSFDAAIADMQQQFPGISLR